MMYEAQQYGEANYPELVWYLLGRGTGVGVQSGTWDTPEFRCAGVTAGTDGFDLDCYQGHGLALAVRAASLEAACDAGAAWCAHGPVALARPIAGVDRVERDPEAPRPEVLGVWQRHLEPRSPVEGDAFIAAGFRPLVGLLVEHPQLVRVYAWTSTFWMSFSRCSGQGQDYGFGTDALGGYTVIGPHPGRPGPHMWPLALARPMPGELQTEEDGRAFHDRLLRAINEVEGAPDSAGTYVLCPPEGPGRLVSAEECAAELVTHLRPGGASAAIPARSPGPA